MIKLQISNDWNPLAGIEIDGVIYDVVPRNSQRLTTSAEPELKTFEDCFLKVLPKWYLNDMNKIKESDINPNYSEIRQNQLPTENAARQIQAAIKLFVVMYALQGTWKPFGGDEAHYVTWDNGFITCSAYGLGGYNPYAFKCAKTAAKAIEIAKDIWSEYFGIQ